MPQNYSLRLRCPYGDMDTWVVFENRSETLEEVLASSWDFECDAHGVQREIPIQANLIGPILQTASSAAPGFAPGATPNPAQELPVDEQIPPTPVVVYGWSKNHGTFHEDTTTLQGNASGAVVPMRTKLELGETCFLLNKATHKEKEIRIVHVGTEPPGETNVCVTFSKPDPDFWKATRSEPRVMKAFKVDVIGTDGNANRFSQTAYTVDISNNGARLSGVSELTRPGHVIEVKRRWHGKARYRVVWVGQIGLEHANQIGVCCLEPEKNIWGVVLPEGEADDAEEAKSPKKKP